MILTKKDANSNIVEQYTAESIHDAILRGKFKPTWLVQVKSGQWVAASRLFKASWDEVEARLLNVAATKKANKQAKAQRREKNRQDRIQRVEYRAQSEAEEAFHRKNMQIVKNATTSMCPFCKTDIPFGSMKCAQCGEILDREMRDNAAPAKFNPGVAGVLSFFFPGVGHIYKGELGNGLAILILLYPLLFAVAVVMFLVTAGLAAIVIIPAGLALHILIIWDSTRVHKVKY